MAEEPKGHVDGSVVTHSLIKTFRRCPRQALYKHHDLLAPRGISKPLHRGKWIHALLEAFYKGEDYKEVHKAFSLQFARLFDEEKEALGPLPAEIGRLFKSYLWHYQNDESWDVKEVEFKLEAELPTGGPWQGKSDMLVEDEFGLWIVDHKTHKQLPSLTHRMLDQQSVLYLWAARENGIPVQGFIWNYLRTKGPAEIKLLRDNSIGKRQAQTDYPTAFLSLKKQGVDPKEYRSFLAPLREQRYDPDKTQTSPFFQRHIMEKSDEMIERAVLEADHTARRFREYDFEARDAVERVPDRSCDWCGYKNLCTTELIGGNWEGVARREFIKHDPFAYYDEDPLKEM